MVNLHDINLKETPWKHLCGVSMKIFPERPNWGEKTHLECGQHCPMVGVLHWLQSRVWVWVLAFLPLLPDHGCSVISFYSFLAMMNYTLQLWATTALPSLRCCVSCHKREGSKWKSAQVPERMLVYSSPAIQLGLFLYQYLLFSIWFLSKLQHVSTRTIYLWIYLFTY